MLMEGFPLYIPIPKELLMLVEGFPLYIPISKEPTIIHCYYSCNRKFPFKVTLVRSVPYCLIN